MTRGWRARFRSGAHNDVSAGVSYRSARPCGVYRASGRGQRGGVVRVEAARKNTPRAAGTAADAITATTIAEAQKIHAVHFSAMQCEQLAASVPTQVKSVVNLRRVPRALTLQPAIHFDPRLPGKRYPPQRNFVRLSSAHEAPLPRDDSAIAYAPVTYLSNWIRTGQLTSTRLTELYLERIASIAPRLYCYITVCADLARSQAKVMDAELKAGKYRGPLHGVPYSIKDVFDTAGSPPRGVVLCTAIAYPPKMRPSSGC